MDDVLRALRQYVLERHLPGECPESLPDDTRLVSSGILDSMAVLELAGFVATELGVQLHAADTMLDSFDRLRDIAHLVERRRRETAA